MKIKHGSYMNFFIKRALLASVVIGGVAVLAGCSDSVNIQPKAAQAGTQQADAQQSPARKVIAAPQFKLTTLRGREFSLSAMRGKTVVVNLWASWCGPCRDETPALERLYKSFKDSGVEFVGVAVDENFKDVNGFVGQFGVTYPVGLDDTGNIARDYGVNYIPKTVIVAPDGNVSFIYNGMIDEAHLRQQILKLQAVAQR